MGMLNGVRNFLMIINDEWVNVIVIIGLVIAIIQKVKAYMNTTTEEKIAIAKSQIGEVMLKLIADAEVDFEKWNEAGSIKRSQVIKQIYTDYPILSKAVDQDEIIKWIDEMINESLKTLRKIVKENMPVTIEE